MKGMQTTIKMIEYWMADQLDREMQAQRIDLPLASNSSFVFDMAF